MSGKFKYYLKPTATTYYMVTNGIVGTAASPVPLSNSPMEWKDTNLQWKRNEKYHGVFRAFAIPLTFVGDAATILRSIYYTQGIEGKCTFLIEQQDHTDDLYKTIYSGDIDFSQANDDRLSFQVAILDAGISALIKGKSNTPYEIPVLPADALNVFMDGILLRANAHYVVPEQGNTSSIALSNSISILPGIPEGINKSILGSSASQLLPSDLTLGHNKIYTSTYAETVTVKAKMNVYASWPNTATSPVKFTLGITYGPTGGPYNNYPLFQAPAYLSPGSSDNYVINTGYTFALAAGDSIQVLALMLDSSNTILSSSNSRVKVTSLDGTIDISSDFVLPPSTVLAYRQIQVYQKLISLMSGGQYSVVSSHLTTPSLSIVDSKPYNVLLTCGDAVRGLGTGGRPAKIVTTLDEMHQDGSARDMVGIGTEGTNVRVERLPYFYNNSVVIADVGEVSGFTASPAIQHMCNQVKVGYTLQTNDDPTASLNGKDDFATSQTYASTGIRVKAGLDLISPFIASMYVEEYMRANLSGKNTTDTKTDNDTFLIEVNDNPSSVTVNTGSAPISAYTLARKQNAGGSNFITGLISAVRAFNGGVTTKRNLLRNGPRLHVPFHLQDSTVLTFQTTDKNAEVISNLGSGTIIEKANVPVSSLPAPLFLPIVFQFTTEVPVDLPALIANNPYGRINFTVRNRRGKLIHLGGFIDEVGIKPADNAVYQWKLLACPDSNLSELIN
jgi:hypothetical protein